MNEPANFGTNEERPWNWPVEAKPYWSLKCPTNNPLEDPPYRTSETYWIHFDMMDSSTTVSHNHLKQYIVNFNQMD